MSNQLRALVTGASRGIGLAITRDLYEKGVQVVGLGKSADNLKALRNQFPKVETICVNLSDWIETRNAISNLGPFNYVVNNAAHAVRLDTLTMSHEDLERHFAVNVKSVVNITQVVAQDMIKNGKGGSIVNVSSLSGLKPYKRLTAYAMSKAALNHYTKLMALELSQYKIRVNAVSPGVTRTDMVDGLFSQPHLIPKLNTSIPIGKYAEPADVAKVVAFLLSEDAYMVTGHNIPIDGGVLLT